MKLFRNCIILLLPLLSFSQQKKIDSLNIELQKHATEDLNRIKILNELASHYQLTDPEKGLIKSQEAIQIAFNLKQKDQEAKAYKNKANNLKQLHKDSLAIEAYNKAISIQTELKNWDEVAKTTFNKGITFYNLSNYPKAIECNIYSYKIFEKQKDSFLMAIVLNSKGINQTYLSLYPDALDSFLKASSLFEKINKGNSQRHAEVFTNIGILYSKLEKYDLALEYYNKSLTINKLIEYDFAMANVLNNIGNVYDNYNQPEKAITYYQRSLEIMKKINNKYGIASALTNTGIAYTTLKDYKKALHYLNKTKVLFEELQDKNSLAIVHESIGNAYFESSELYLAKENYNLALSYANEINSIRRKASSLENLANINVSLKNYKSAYDDLKEAETLKDSFISVEKKEEIVRNEELYKYEKKEADLTAIHFKEQAIKESEISHQKFIKNTSIIGGSSLAFTTIISFILYRRKQKAKAKAKEAKFNLKVADTELKALRAQMNPHFIFNSLNSINEYISKNDTESATNYLTKFSKLMRETLEKSTESEILLEEDIQILKTYMDIENKRSNDSFTYKIIIDDAIEPGNTLIPPMILQPFVENSIIHGLGPVKKNGEITISFIKNGDMMICSVEDNGIGRKKSSERKGQTKKQSLGMTITKNRIDILNNKRNTNGTVNIIDQSNGTLIEVKLPLTLAF